MILVFFPIPGARANPGARAACSCVDALTYYRGECAAGKGRRRGRKAASSGADARLVGDEVHGVQQEVLHDAVAGGLAIIARDEADGDARVLGGIERTQHGGELGLCQL